MNNEHGGSYTINEQGERVLTQVPTQDHPEGNRAREAVAETIQVKPSKKTVTETIQTGV